MKITILGCGASSGVPSISTGWGQCDPANPRNLRRRASILVEQGDCAILVDSGPDLRAQLLDAGVKRLDAVIYTHAHADHLHGIDELREVNRAMGGPIQAYGSPKTIAQISDRFGYVFQPLELTPGRTIYRPWLIPHAVEEPFTVGPMTVEPLVQDHGFGAASTGLRFGRFAYSTDLADMPEATFERLHGLDLWIVGCFGFKEHPTHVHIDKALRWIDRLKPKQALITHMSTSLDYVELTMLLPSGTAPAYDGLVITI